jgi:hypothetical protein
MGLFKRLRNLWILSGTEIHSNVLREITLRRPKQEISNHQLASILELDKQDMFKL